MSKERKATKRLTDFNFNEDFCHVALVDQAANEHGILVMKAKEPAKAQEQQSPVNKNTAQVETVEPKEDNMSEVVTKKEDEVVVVVKDCGENHKAENCPTCKKKKEDTKMEKSLESEVLKNKVLADELAVFKAEKIKAEKAVFVAKSMEQKTVVKEDVAEVLYKCSQALTEDEYQVLSKCLETANTALEAMEVVTKTVGSSEEAAPEMSEAETVIAKSKVLMADDSSLSGPAARTKARDIIRAEAKKTAE